MSRSCDWCNTRVVGTEPEWVCGKCFAGVRAERDAALAAKAEAEAALEAERASSANAVKATADMGYAEICRVTKERDAALAAQSAAEHALRDLEAREAKVGEYEDAILRLEREREEARTVRDVATTAVNDIGVAMQKEQAAHAETERRALALAASGERMRAANEAMASTLRTFRDSLGREGYGGAVLMANAALQHAALSASPSPGLGAAVVAMAEAAREAFDVLTVATEKPTNSKAVVEAVMRGDGEAASRRLRSGMARDFKAWQQIEDRLSAWCAALTAYEAAVAGNAQDAQGQGQGKEGTEGKAC